MQKQLLDQWLLGTVGYWSFKKPINKSQIRDSMEKKIFTEDLTLSRFEVISSNTC